MPPRKAHHKSRNGCDQCKQRRVKCDERGPPCSNCINRELECIYTRKNLSQYHKHRSDNYLCTPSPASGTSPEALPVTKTSPVIVVEEDTSNQPERLRELELMHHWCTSTCHSFSAKASDIFQGFVVKQAFKHDYLLDAILAMSCLHIASELSDRTAAASYVSNALQYQNKSLAAYRIAIKDVTPMNCDAIFACSVLCMASAIVSPLLPTGNSDITSSPTENITVMVNFLLGIGSVLDISRQWLEAGPFKRVFEHSIDLPPPDEGISLQLQRLKKLNSSITILVDSVKYHMYNRAIEELETCLIIDRTTSIAWLSVAGVDFCHELRKKEPFALMIFIYWGVALDKLEEMWWAKLSGKKIVQELSGKLLGFGSEWDECIEWARNEVGL